MLIPEKKKVFGLVIPKQCQSYWPYSKMSKVFSNALKTLML